MKTGKCEKCQNATTFPKIKGYCSELIGYYPLYRSTVSREFKGKFKNTILGGIWHILNPLLQILVYYVAFSIIFGKNIENYWLYASSGLFTFHFISSALITGASAITSNQNTISKVHIPKEILVFSKITTCSLTLIITYFVLIGLSLMSGIGITVHLLELIPLILIMVMMMTGIAFILSFSVVYIRDIYHALPILVNCLMFSLPIFYMPSQLSGSLDLVWQYNPFFYFVECAHDAIYYHEWCDITSMFILFIISVLTLLIGWLLFIKKEKRLSDLL